MRDSLPPEYARLVQADGSVVVPGAVAEGMLRLLVLGTIEVSKRNAGGLPTAAVIAVLTSLQQAAIKAAEAPTSDHGSDGGEKRIMGIQPGSWMGSKEAAALLQCTDRAIRLACEQGRLPAQMISRHWLILESDLDTYRFGKTPHGKRTTGGTRNGC